MSLPVVLFSKHDIFVGKLAIGIDSEFFQPGTNESKDRRSAETSQIFSVSIK